MSFNQKWYLARLTHVVKRGLIFDPSRLRQVKFLELYIKLNLIEFTGCNGV